MKEHIEIDKSNCTGCGACLTVCPVGAIRFEEDSMGFLFPVVDDNKCIACGKCVRSCQLYNESEHSIIKAYAIQIKDRSILLDSSSGGAFTAIAIEILRRNGLVYGCVFDKNCEAVYLRANCIEDTVQMRGSKYVWADASPYYEMVLSDLKERKRVLFCGLPCQVNGLLLYLGEKYENLTTVDFLCGGPPSPSVFKAYIEKTSEI